MRVPGAERLRAVYVGLVLFGIAGCKDPGEKSQAACEELVASHECGDEVKNTFPCESYSTSTCDLSPYFDCVADNLTCDGAVSLDGSACAEFLCPEEEEGEGG